MLEAFGQVVDDRLGSLSSYGDSAEVGRSVVHSAVSTADLDVADVARVGVVGIAQTSTEVGTQMLVDLVARTSLQAEDVLEPLELAIYGVLVGSLDRVNELGKASLSCWGESPCGEGSDHGGSLLSDGLRDRGDECYVRLELRKTAREAGLTTTAEDACDSRECPVTLLIRSHERGDDGRGGLPLEALGSSACRRVSEWGEGSVDVTALEYGLAVDREAPAVGREDKTCGIVVGRVDSERGITREATQVEGVEAGIVQQTPSVCCGGGGEGDEAQE